MSISLIRWEQKSWGKHSNWRQCWMHLYALLISWRCGWRGVCWIAPQRESIVIFVGLRGGTAFQIPLSW